jgi:trehalose 6-phosphate phosphatase
MTDRPADRTHPAGTPADGEVRALPLRLDGLAVFLDVDGTLLDIAPTPDAVVVADGLAEDLAALSERLGGALALVSGRGLAFLRDLFPTLSSPLAGLHGAELDLGAGTFVALQRWPAMEQARQDLAAAAAAWPGVVIEDKGNAFAGHFRLAPRFAGEVAQMMTVLAERLGESVVLQKGKDVIEIRPAGHDKGTALDRIMALATFAGRRPLAIGDDLTDEAMFSAANRRDGISVKVGLVGDSVSRHRIGSAADVRAWLREVTG